MDSNELDNEKDMRRFLTKKYWQEIIFAIVVFVSIIITSYCGLIDKCTTGTLMGTGIGYFLRGIRKLHE
jgi:hypothetical protein